MGLKDYGKQLRNSLLFSKRTIRILLLLLLIVFLYYCAVEPVLTRYIIPTTCIHEGVAFYHNAQYLEFESGHSFLKVLNETAALESGVVFDFYHVDNHLRDNPLYGKMCDVFAIDIKTEPLAYTDTKSSIIESSEYCCSMDDYELYVLDVHTGVEEEIVLVALCDRMCYLRYILLTDKDPVSINSQYGATLIQQSSLDWKISP